MHTQDEDGIVVRVPNHLIIPGKFKLQFSVELTDVDAHECACETASSRHEQPQRSFRASRTFDRPDAASYYHFGAPYARPHKTDLTRELPARSDLFEPPSWTPPDQRDTLQRPPKKRNWPLAIDSEKNSRTDHSGSPALLPGTDPTDRTPRLVHPEVVKTGLASPNTTLLAEPTASTASASNTQLGPPMAVKPAPFTADENMRLIAAIREGKKSVDVYPEFSHLSKDQFKVRYSRLKKRICHAA